MKYIIDTDPGVDDAIAIMMAVRNKLDVIGISIASGNIPLEKCENNIKIIEDFLESNIPIYKGMIKKENKNFAEFAHGKDGLGYAVFPKQKTRRVEKMSAEKFFSKACNVYKDNITIICLGPLTNLANALKKDPSIAKKVSNLVIMGATYNPRSKKDYLEYNVKIDPKAANTVFNAPFKNIHVITHEIGIKSFIEESEINLLHDSDDIVSRFVANIAQKYIEFSYNKYKTPGLGSPDPITIASLLSDELISYKPAKIEVTPDAICHVEILKESNMQISVDFNLEKYREIFKSTFH